MKNIKNLVLNFFVFIFIFIFLKFQYIYNMTKDQITLTNKLCSLMLSNTDESIKEIERLLNDNPDIINTTNCGNDNSPLNIAIEKNNNKIVNFLLNYSKSKGLFPFRTTYKVNINLPNNVGDRPIIIALKNKNFEAFDLLLANPDIELNVINLSFNNILHELLMLDLNTQEKKNLIQKIINIYKYKKKYGAQNLKSFINYQNANGYTPLHIAAEKGYFGIYDLLKNNGASENIENLKGQTPKNIIEKERHKNVKKIAILDLIKFKTNMVFLNSYYRNIKNLS